MERTKGNSGNNTIISNKGNRSNTSKSCISKAIIVHKSFTETNLSPELEEELLNLFNDVNIDEGYIIDNMDYLDDIESTIETFRANYHNDNSFKLSIKCCFRKVKTE